jgi:hypothetical protein
MMPLRATSARVTFDEPVSGLLTFGAAALAAKTSKYSSPDFDLIGKIRRELKGMEPLLPP